MAYISFQPKDHFNTKLYTGTGSELAVSSVGFQPDWVWLKDRGAVASHILTDAVRTATKVLKSNTTGAESTNAQALKSFDSDGFTLGTTSDINTSSNTYVSWNWKANGSGSSNTDGSITSTVSASTTSGFSIVKWTGSGGNATIGHGLGVVPKMIIIKSLANTTSWMVYTAMTGNNSEIALNTTASATGSSTAWQDTDPTSSVFYVAGGAGDGVNASGDYVAYCFANIRGFSKFGEYTGNENADGTFVYTGFKPAFVMIKNRGSAGKDWFIHDNKRLGYNDKNYGLFPNLTNAEATDINLDLLSNGFKLRRSTAQLNHNGNFYIFMAFAESPLVGSNNIPATAR